MIKKYQETLRNIQKNRCPSDFFHGFDIQTLTKTLTPSWVYLRWPLDLDTDRGWVDLLPLSLRLWLAWLEAQFVGKAWCVPCQQQISFKKLCFKLKGIVMLCCVIYIYIIYILYHDISCYVFLWQHDILHLQPPRHPWSQMGPCRRGPYEKTPKGSLEPNNLGPVFLWKNSCNS